ncbi:putative protein-disulfide oxidoreductase [Alteripontixanthobacter maritimus]|uniref:Thioredoxin-like fold domain-containing protein n=1 Tax=Alteripontixanthobacter maritimus TaxID=2161824 RepID=A0A369Q8J1_9SPHN|nr:thioredoxin domain-containing protein [Alteripontixanthobacter maritimus]RDC59577.1 putative protein-disulfide oxidoreductase [Alteripontixanthobacter maritimus]
MKATLRRIATTTMLALFALPAMASAQNWNATVEKIEGGHLIGNPEAEVELVEFVSYTCPHCAQFTKDGEGALRLVYIRSGRLSLQIRHFIRDDIDLTVALLARCGTTDKFVQNHTAFMLSQPTWLAEVSKMSAAQRQRWAVGTGADRRRAIASDLRFYRIMERRGYQRNDIDRCLADAAEVTSLQAADEANRAEFGVAGTPSFMVDGILLAGTHDWAMLQPQLDARF